MNVKYTLMLQEGFDCGPVLAVMTTLLTVAFQEVGMIIVNLYLFHESASIMSLISFFKR